MGEERESLKQKEEHFSHLESSVHSSHYKSVQCVSIQLHGEGVKLVMKALSEASGDSKRECHGLICAFKGLPGCPAGGDKARGDRPRYFMIIQVKDGGLS